MNASKLVVTRSVHSKITITRPQADPPFEACVNPLEETRRQEMEPRPFHDVFVEDGSRFDPDPRGQAEDSTQPNALESDPLDHHLAGRQLSARFNGGWSGI